MAAEERVEEGGDRGAGFLEGSPRQDMLLREDAVRHRPRGRRRRYGLGDHVRRTEREGRGQRGAEPDPVDDPGAREQGQVREVTDPRVLSPRTSGRPGVGVELLGDVRLDGVGRDAGGIYADEVEEVVADEFVGRPMHRVTHRDVHPEG